MKRKLSLMAPLLALFVSAACHAGPYSQTGVIFDHTSVEGALLIRFDPNVTPMPENCPVTGSNWMIIPEGKKTLMAVTLMALGMGNRTMTVYTKGAGLYGYCEVTQVDPEH
jgi:hypothetical protein